jgi:hypothetical protein
VQTPFRAVVLVLVVASASIATSTSSTANAERTRLVNITLSLTSGAIVPGAGLVRINGTDAQCKTSCTFSVPDSADVTLVAIAGSGYRFDRWSDAHGCNGQDPRARICTLVPGTRAIDLGAAFNPRTKVLQVVAGGVGSVTSGGNGIECGESAEPDRCAASFGEGVRVRLTAEPGPNARLVGWSVAECPGRRLTCDVVVSADRTVEAMFDPVRLTVRRVGMGGAITSKPGDVRCSSGCTAASVELPRGTEVNLRADATSAEAPFRRWGEPCGGPLPDCRLPMLRNTTVEAAFGFNAPAIDQLSGGSAVFLDWADNISVELLGRGKGTVTIRPGPVGGGRGIRCLSRCSVSGYQYSQQIWLKARRANGSRFAGWLNGCQPHRRRKCGPLYAVGHNTIKARFVRRKQQ